ncbi:MAG: heme-copper oxidase subunit III [Nitrospinota bacterium]|nr:MAG: heme-copper oxidase subunit III [Nitrospinota bacterium]
MSTAAVTHPQYDRLALNRLGLWLFFISESMIFLILLTTRFYLFGTSRPEELNQALGLVITVILLLSSLTAYRAESSIAHGDRQGFLRNLLATIILGTVFLLGVVAWEWPEAPHLGITPQEGFGIAFFSMTGMHAFHVLTGVLFLLVVYLNGRRGAYSAEKHWGVEASVKYWHFVDVVWVFFYPALYLIQ